MNEWNFFFAAVFFRPCLGPFVSFPRCTQLLSNFCGREGLKGHVRLAVMPAALSPLTLGVPFFNILPVKNQTPIRLKRSSFFLLLNLLSKKMNEKSWFSVFEQSEEMSWDLCLLKSLAKQSSFSSDLLFWQKQKNLPRDWFNKKQSGYNSIKIHTMWLLLHIIFSSNPMPNEGVCTLFFASPRSFRFPCSIWNAFPRAFLHNCVQFGSLQAIVIDYCLAKLLRPPLRLCALRTVSSKRETF